MHSDFLSHFYGVHQSDYNMRVFAAYVTRLLLRMGL